MAIYECPCTQAGSEFCDGTYLWTCQQVAGQGLCWVQSASPCCTNGDVIRATCPDGTMIATALCVNGVWTQTDERCPLPTVYQTSLSIYTDEPAITLGQPILVYGFLKKTADQYPIVGGHVRIWIQSSENGSTLVNVLTDSNGYYEYTTYPNKPGTWAVGASHFQEVIGINTYLKSTSVPEEFDFQVTGFCADGIDPSLCVGPSTCSPGVDTFCQQGDRYNCVKRTDCLGCYVKQGTCGACEPGTTRPKPECPSNGVETCQVVGEQWAWVTTTPCQIITECNGYEAYLTDDALIRATGTQTIYVMRGGTKRAIGTQEALFACFGAYPVINDLPATCVNAIPSGANLTTCDLPCTDFSSVLVDGNLVEGDTSAPVYLLQSDPATGVLKKRHVMSQTAMTICGWTMNDVHYVPQACVDAIPAGENITSCGTTCVNPSGVEGDADCENGYQYWCHEGGWVSLNQTCGPQPNNLLYAAIGIGAAVIGGVALLAGGKKSGGGKR